MQRCCMTNVKAHYVEMLHDKLEVSKLNSMVVRELKVTLQKWLPPPVSRLEQQSVGLLQKCIKTAPNYEVSKSSLCCRCTYKMCSLQVKSMMVQICCMTNVKAHYVEMLHDKFEVLHTKCEVSRSTLKYQGCCRPGAEMPPLCCRGAVESLVDAAYQI